MEKKDQWNIGYWIVAGLLLLTLQNYWQAAKTVEPVPYSEFEKALAEGRVAEVLVSDRTVTGRLKSPDSRGKTTIVAARVEPDLAERLSKYNVPYARVAESTQARIDQAIRDIVMGVFERAYRILDINRAVLERCARELLARETLDENDILQLIQGLVLDGNEK
ncbi:ATP-dependent metallopeptidase FtsH/Yme1/Tma family protein [Ralstonia mannitolilytica]|uniref:ATP-dependent metallopeptidase FtsH/Yme1/Tma family protein n=1 Tax=Pseudomonadota TaxID=1224 RepID=UPI003B841A09